MTASTCLTNTSLKQLPLRSRQQVGGPRLVLATPLRDGFRLRWDKALERLQALIAVVPPRRRMRGHAGREADEPAATFRARCLSFRARGCGRGDGPRAMRAGTILAFGTAEVDIFMGAPPAFSWAFTSAERERRRPPHRSRLRRRPYDAPRDIMPRRQK